MATRYTVAGTVAGVILGGAALLNVGTSTGTVAAGDDSRITGAVQASTLTTNGDLLTRAAGVPARLGVGTEGYVLTVASGAPAWAAAAAGGETALPRLAVSGALHHWRCDEASSPFADLGSSPVSLAYVSGTREYDRAGLYARYGATMQRSPAATDRAEAVVSDIPSGTDFSFGVTFANETGSISPPNITSIAVVNNGLGAGSSYGIYLLTANTGSGLYLGVHHGAVTADSGVVAIDWSRPHRAEVTYVTATRTATLYVDGVAAATATPASGTMAALTNCSLGGIATAFGGVSGSTLMVADFTVHLSALSASTILSRADVCRRLAGG
ncbi:MAG: hypothetical protein EPO40_16520 [Myxococcaceae bacterium]|nr:MAG: hypothetical protein EPO40_16520 [Myxococcaceae bacterium]